MLLAFAAFLSVFSMLSLIVQLEVMARLFGAGALTLVLINIVVVRSPRPSRGSGVRGASSRS